MPDAATTKVGSKKAREALPSPVIDAQDVVPTSCVAPCHEGYTCECGCQFCNGGCMCMKDDGGGGE